MAFENGSMIVLLKVVRNEANESANDPLTLETESLQLIGFQI